MSRRGDVDSLAQVASAQVGDRMTNDPITVVTADSCLWALRIMSAANVHHLPVLEGDRLVGIITEGDIYRRSPVHFLSPSDESEGLETLLAHVSVGGVMSYAPITIESASPLTDALERMLSHDVGSLLVVREGRLVGILTERDALRLVLVDLSDATLHRNGTDGSSNA